MVLDVHHHNCNSCEEDIKSLLPKVFSTWEEEKLPPKIHFQVLGNLKMIENMQIL